MKGFEIVLMLALGAGCSTQSVYEDPEPAFENPNYSQPQHYGVDGTLTPEEADWLIGLTCPQTYDAMKSTFGLPAYRSESSDIYQVEDGREIEVFYNGTKATGYETR